MDSEKLKNMHFETQCIHGVGGLDPQTGSISYPIYQTSTFAFHSVAEGSDIFLGKKEGYYYSRLDNPTVAALGREVAILERADTALCFASGMAATTSVILTLVESGANLVASNPIYGGTYNLFHESLPRLQIGVKEVSATELSRVEDAIDEKTRLIFIETPVNPTMSVIDIAGCAEIAKRHNILLAVDNTFATPYFQRPIELGADIVVHSATKYICGHGDVIAGLVAGPKDIIKEIHKISSKNFGPTMAPFNAWLLIRGLKTLPVRMDRHAESAMKIARYLEAHPMVESVNYPGLQDHPQYEIAKRQMSGYSGMVSFYIKGGRKSGERLMNSVELFTLAVSLGDVDSLIEHPASMTHHGYSEESLKEVGITGGLVRISVGLEHVDDLIADLNQAFDKAAL